MPDKDPSRQNRASPLCRKFRITRSCKPSLYTCQHRGRSLRQARDAAFATPASRTRDAEGRGREPQLYWPGAFAARASPRGRRRALRTCSPRRASPASFPSRGSRRGPCRRGAARVPHRAWRAAFRPTSGYMPSGSPSRLRALGAMLGQSTRRCLPRAWRVAVGHARPLDPLALVGARGDFRAEHTQVLVARVASGSGSRSSPGPPRARRRSGRFSGRAHAGACRARGEWQWVTLVPWTPSRS
jgi:hypothetical protein